VLEEIPGIGTGRKKALLRHFGALKRVKEATLDEIAQVEGFGPKQARAVFEFFHRPDAPAEVAEAMEAEEREGDPAAAPAGAGPDAAPVAATEAEIDAVLAEDDANSA
jgi:excinuclease ABC subunit C